MRLGRVFLVIKITFCLLAVSFVRASVAHADAASEAKDHFENGKRSFRLGDYDDAIKEWKAGYHLKDDPIFLYNIAQAYREKKEFENAIRFYENYLKEAKTAPNRDTVQQRIAELKDALKKREEASHAPPSGPLEPGPKGDTSPKTTASTDVRPKTPPPADADSAKPPVAARPAPKAPSDLPPVSDQPEPAETGAHPGRTMKIAGIATAGAGVALVATGIVFGLKASSNASDVQAAVDAGQPWTPEIADKDASGKSAATISVVTLGLGVAAIAGGGVLYFLGTKKDRAAAQPSETSRLLIIPELGPARAGIHLSVRY